MAKKNSTKTATKEAMQAAEPRLQAFTGWQGINIEQTPLTWTDNPAGWLDMPNQTDLKPNYLLIQNNVDTTSNLTLETRAHGKELAFAPYDHHFTGVTYLKQDILYAVTRCEGGYELFYKSISNNNLDWTIVPFKIWEKNGVGAWNQAQKNTLPFSSNITCVYSYCVNGHDSLIVLTETDFHQNDEYSNMFTCPLDKLGRPASALTNARKIPSDGYDIFVSAGGSYSGATQKIIWEAGYDPSDLVCTATFYYSLINKYGMTPPLESTGTVVDLKIHPLEFTTQDFLAVRLGKASSSSTARDIILEMERMGVESIAFYCTLDNATSPIFIGIQEIEELKKQTEQNIAFNWYGSMANTYEWSNAPLTPSGENTTLGIQAEHCRQHDGRLYFWGNHDKPYRLYIGGNAGNELTEEQGLGGDWIDIDPGTGMVIHGTYKFKTTSGASIVTILCGNPNTGLVKRYNLVDTTITISNELNQQSYMPEEVSNVVGCNSEWGAGVFADGLYALSRYGLTVTTQQMEYSSQLQSTVISDPIKPVFTDRLAWAFNDARMIYINRCIYFAISNVLVDSDDAPTPERANSLDDVIFCYDLDTKAWYTYTVTPDFSEPHKEILHLMNIDYEGLPEGIGVVFKDKVCIIPTAGSPDYADRTVDFVIETGELTAKQPTSSTTYVSQLEFRWDYFVGHAEIFVEGVDYYGRRIQVKKTVHEDEVNYDHVEWMRLDYLFENYHVRIRGNARFRMTHFNAKVYPQSNKVGLVYGFNDGSAYLNRHGGVTFRHHYIRDYNNLKEAIIP